jgi:prepilin-type N-terminal cleavage/methylation domain-containing protein
MNRQPPINCRSHLGFTLIELLVVIAILTALLLPVLARAKQKGQQSVYLSNLKEIGLAFTMYLNDNGSRFADRRDLKNSLPGGYRPWTTWPLSDPRGGWAAVVLKDQGTSDPIWSCPTAINSPLGQIIQVLQAGSRCWLARVKWEKPLWRVKSWKRRNYLSITLIVDSLIETTISRDILLMTRVDKTALLRRLFHLDCAYSGQILSYQKMLRKL